MNPDSILVIFTILLIVNHESGNNRDAVTPTWFLLFICYVVSTVQKQLNDLINVSVKMKNTIFVFYVSVFIIMSGCSKMSAESIEYSPTPGSTTNIDSPGNNPESIRHFVEIFPNEINYGDTIYLIAYDENISNEIVFSFPETRLPMYEFLPENFALSTEGMDREYHWLPEHPSNSCALYEIEMRDLLPGEKRPFMMYYFDFPPLEDWNDPFWKELRERIPPEGISCNLRIKYEYKSSILEPRTIFNGSQISTFADRTMEADQDILIRTRPEAEMTLLSKWYNNTSENLFPSIDGNCKVPNLDTYDLKSSGQSDIVINSVKYDPWMFIRLGNRKPSDPNNPTTLDGWRKLEASLIPSTMRDEVRLTRLQLEYYSAKKGEASENAKNELVEWLQSLPEIQRNFFLNFLVGTMYDIAHSRDDYNKPTRLSEKNRELMRTLSNETE